MRNSADKVKQIQGGKNGAVESDESEGNDSDSSFSLESLSDLEDLSPEEVQKLVQ